MFSALGAHTVMSVKADVLKPLILCLLIAVAIYTYWRKDLGNLHTPQFALDEDALVVGVAAMGSLLAAKSAADR